jgi:hypothetical protein
MIQHINSRQLLFHSMPYDSHLSDGCLVVWVKGFLFLMKLLG